MKLDIETQGSDLDSPEPIEHGTKTEPPWALGGLRPPASQPRTFQQFWLICCWVGPKDPGDLGPWALEAAGRQPTFGGVQGGVGGSPPPPAREIWHLILSGKGPGQHGE